MENLSPLKKIKEFYNSFFYLAVYIFKIMYYN